MRLAEMQKELKLLAFLRQAAKDRAEKAAANRYGERIRVIKRAMARRAQDAKE